MRILKTERVEIVSESDVVQARQHVRRWTQELGFRLVDQTRVVTATSELARNTFVHGGGGEMTAEFLQNGARSGLRLTFADEGPGIPDVERAMQDGYTTGTGLGMGLGGSKRLVNEFDISSESGKGTQVVITKWGSR